jgi:serine/threonine-protein kinase RsbW
VSTLLFQCRIGNSVEELPRILDGLESTGLQHDWDPVFQMQLTLVIEELVVNAVNYGGQLPGQGWAEVRIDAAEDGVSVTIEDNGQAFDPFSVAEPDTELDLDSRAIGGLGVHFVREMTESHGYERAGAINRVTLFKRLSGR